MFGALIVLGGALYVGLKAYKEGKKKQRHLSSGRIQTIQKNKLSSFATTGEHDQRMTISATSLGLAIVGGLLYPPLSLACIPALLYLSWPVFRDTYRSVIQEGRVSRAVPGSVITLVCLINGYFWALSLGLWLTSFSRKMVRTTEANARQSLLYVFGEQPQSTWITKDGIEIEMPFTALKPGDVVVVEAGNFIPVDGNIVEGSALVDQHRLTRETRPAAKGIGDSVFACGLVLAGRIEIRVEKIGEQTMVAQLVQILNGAVASQVDAQSDHTALADQMALPMLGLGALASFALSPISAIALMNSSLGYDSDMLISTAALSFLNVTVQDGILIKDGSVIETLNQVDTIVFDRQTSLRPEVSAVIRSLRRRNIDEIDVLADGKTFSRRQLVELGVDRCFTAILAEDQAAVIATLQAEGKCVCYVGDGIYDVLVMRQANVAVSLRDISTIAENSAQIVLMDASLNRFGQLFDMARDFEANIARTFNMTFAPGALNMASALLLHSGLVTSILLNNLGLIAGMGNAVLPVLDYELEKLRRMLDMLSGFASFGRKQDTGQANHNPQPSSGLVQLQMN